MDIDNVGADAHVGRAGGKPNGGLKVEDVLEGFATELVI
ncbi:hypothetical protein MBENS4_0286 [Novosphingobium sp. MBES04]|nr:hypothetical protein MBENS4_0286 [Novosphingobium sp. MBES04]